MGKRICFYVVLAILSLFFPMAAHATYDPLSQANNKVGIHILFPSELEDAARLINTNGGQWGYVTIPIQAGDRDLQKWQAFMDEAGRLKVIPLVRLATENDYFQTGNWHKPDKTDILDFANFLHSLNWPTKNEYVIVFNEPNNANEWGGQVDPADYASLLSYAVTVFKSRDPDFFIISAGLDNAAANTQESMNEYDYLRVMNRAVPGIFNQIDGLGSHSYANPGFSSPPTDTSPESIDSFHYEQSLITSLGGKRLPVFITETGWSRMAINDNIIGSYFQQAFEHVWNDASIVAITPFLLHPNGAQFGEFSFLSDANAPSAAYNAILSLPKIKGTPLTRTAVLGDVAPNVFQRLPREDFSKETLARGPTLSPMVFKVIAKWLLKL